MVKILLIHNRFHWDRPLTWLSYLIRVFTCSKYNHLAVMVNGQIIESIGEGVILSDYTDWEGRADRIVLPLTPKMPVSAAAVMALEGKPYGFLDLIQALRYIKATKWDAKPDFKGKNHKGYICSELGSLLMGYDCFLSPADFENKPDFTKGTEYQTYKR